MPELPIAAVAWYACGIAGFLYWWADEADTDRRLLRDALVVGLLGPVTVLAGLLIRHGLRPHETAGELRPIRVRSDDHRRDRRRR
ncbi:hypothetical protein [Azospirillum sp. ST 5-10]|uniref:hypothetical protein n=1 Tax=unclassified Azospirillum TaxID=2630922 RepID=UPI003F4A5295